MHVSIKAFVSGVKLFEAGRTNFGPRGGQKAKGTLNFHQGGMILALDHFPHECSGMLIGVSLDVVPKCPVGDLHRSLPRVVSASRIGNLSYKQVRRSS